MDWFELVGKWMDVSGWIIQSVAWPVAAIVVAAIFRGEIKALVARVRKGTFAGTAWEFGVDEAYEQSLRAKTAPARPVALESEPGLVEDRGGTDTPKPKHDAPREGHPLPASGVATDGSKLLTPEALLVSRARSSNAVALAMVLGNTRSAIEHVWLQIQDAIDAVYQIDKTLPRGYPHARNLYNPAFMSPSDLESYSNLRSLYQELQRDQAITPSMQSANRFVKLAEDLLTGIDAEYIDRLAKLPMSGN